MSMMIGFILGYIFAWKAGPLDLDKISQAWSEITKSEEVHAYFGGSRMLIGGLLRKVLEAVLGLAINKR